MKKVAILGAGVMGTAVSWPLTDNGYAVNLIGTHLDHDIIQSCRDKRIHPRLKRTIPEQVTPFFIEEIEVGLEGAAFIVSGVNSLGVRWIGEKLAQHVNPGDRVIGITKGLEAKEDGQLVILPELMRQQFPASIREEVTLLAVGGPCIAGELAGRRQSCVYFGSRDFDAAQELADIFRTDYYHVRATNDIQGLEISVALKNAYALGVGIAAGVLEASGGVDHAGAYMHNLSAALFARGASEIYYILDRLGLNTDFAYGLPGVGDLFVTSMGGRSVTLGKLLGMGKTFSEALQVLAGETLEAAMIIQQIGKALPALIHDGRLVAEQVPFMKLLVDVIVHEQPLDLNLDTFFKDVCVLFDPD